MEIVIRTETTADRHPVWQVNRTAFETSAEADLVDALRESGSAMVSLVAEVDGQLVGHIMLSQLIIHGVSGPLPALSLAPMAVLPAFQRRGIGSQLVEAALNAARSSGHTIVIVLGHPEYYPRFGFSAALARTLTSPVGGGAAWMAIELAPDSLQDVAGQVEYPPPFGSFA